MATLTLLAGLLLTGCQDYSLDKIEKPEGPIADIEVTPNPVLFGELAEGTRSAQTVTITSVGDVGFKVTDVQLVTGESFELTTDGTMGNLAPGESSTFIVTWTSTGGTAEGQAKVVTDSLDDVLVDLMGGTSVPDLVIDPDDVNFGNVTEGSRAEETVTLRNEGAAPLIVTSIALTDDAVFSTAYDALPITLDPGATASVTVAFQPSGSGAWTEQLQVASNDPDGIEEAQIRGSSGNQPVAVCYADPDTVEAIHGETDWVGTDSYDPAGRALAAYEWTLISAPAGSSATMPAGTMVRRNFTPDLVGTYEAQLIVENEDGQRSEPCYATLEATPSGDLWVEMFWTRSGDDMDLHLVRPVADAERALTTNDDCYYANCTGISSRDWGVRGDTSDNPILDLDDIPGVGPENINVDSPENGTFTVFVHDYPGSVYNGNNDVTVNIYVGGLLEWTDTRNVNDEDYYAPFAEIDMPSGTVTPL
jgi:hypothetical protein